MSPGRTSTSAEMSPRLRIWLPPMLVGLTAALALIVVANVLVSAVRRRRREFAVLKAIGFDRGQVRATVAYHASTLALVGLVIGVPLGVLVGRVAWTIVAETSASARPGGPRARARVADPGDTVVGQPHRLRPRTCGRVTRPAVALAARELDRAGGPHPRPRKGARVRPRDRARLPGVQMRRRMTTSAGAFLFRGVARVRVRGAAADRGDPAPNPTNGSSCAGEDVGAGVPRAHLPR